MLFFLSFFLQRFVGGVTGISVSRTSIVLSSTVLLGKNISSKDMQYESYRDCKKYSVTVIFYCIFHIKSQFFKTLFQSEFLFDFDDIFTNTSENVCSFR